MLAAISSDITAFVKQKAGKKAKIAVLGFGFKGNPPTSDMRGSSTVDFVGLLRKAGYTNIHGFDPVVTHRDIEALGVKPSVSSSACIKGASAVIVMTNHLAFANMDILKALRATSDNTLFFDCWALFSKEKIQKLKNVTYRTL